jgi:hypothetical protein
MTALQACPGPDFGDCELELDEINGDSQTVFCECRCGLWVTTEFPRRDNCTVYDAEHARAYWLRSGAHKHASGDR